MDDAAAVQRGEALGELEGDRLDRGAGIGQAEQPVCAIGQDQRPVGQAQAVELAQQPLGSGDEQVAAGLHGVGEEFQFAGADHFSDVQARQCELARLHGGVDAGDQHGHAATPCAGSQGGRDQRQTDRLLVAGQPVDETGGQLIECRRQSGQAKAEGGYALRSWHRHSSGLC